MGTASTAAGMRCWLSLPAPGQYCRRLAVEHTLRRRGDRSPATRALLHIGIVTVWILIIVPGVRRRLGRLLGGRLDIDLGRGGNDGRRVGIWVGIRAPVGSHERPDGEHDARPDEDTPMTEATPMPEARPTTECIPRYRAGHEQYHQYPEDCQPLPSHRCCFVLAVHDVSLSCLSYSGPVVRTLPQPSEKILAVSIMPLTRSLQARTILLSIGYLVASALPPQSPWI